MIEKNKSEKNLLKLIDNEEYKTIINIICEIVQKIWSSEVRIVKEYTDHGYEHSQRIINKIAEMLKQFPHALKEEEMFLLLLGVYLHDIGMQCDIKKHPDIKELAIKKYSAQFDEDYASGTANSFTLQEQNEIRRNHNLLTVAWIEYSYENETILSNFIKHIDSTYLEDLITICMYHSKLSINDCPVKSRFKEIRLRLVATILRFGDELDIDKHRVHIETVKEFSYNTENALFWYLHSRTTISIKKSAIKISVLLNDKDYDRYHSYINNIYIQRFKSKNKVLTDIMTQEGINFFISEDSQVEKNSFEEDIPEEIILNIKKMFNDQFQEEMIEKLKLIDNQPDKILELLLGKEEKNNFMHNYMNEFINEAEKIKLLIDKLQSTYHITDTEIDEIVTIFDTFRWKPDIDVILNNEIYMERAYIIFLCVKTFRSEQLSYLSDIGLRLPIQVSSGQAYSYAQYFFEKYFKYKNNQKQLEKYVLSEVYFDSYIYEQIARILRAYKEIINFDEKNIEFSDYYIYPNTTAGKILAASVAGESNKILVWNIESRKHEPIAALGGLFETVNNIKIYRCNGKVIIAACGRKRIYFWDLNLSNGEPTYILESKENIKDYVLFKSINSRLYTMGLIENRICIWELFERKEPIIFLGVSDDIFIVNTRLSNFDHLYEKLGENSFTDSECPSIIEFVEKTPLNFERVLRLDIYKTIDINQRSIDEDNHLNAYTVNRKNGDTYLLIGNDIYAFYMGDSELHMVEKREGQLILGMTLKSQDEKDGLLTYSIYQEYREKLDLIHYYKCEHKNIVEHKKWLVEPHDIGYATFSEICNETVFYFIYTYDNKLYTINHRLDSCIVFYTLPNTFFIKHITCE